MTKTPRVSLEQWRILQAVVDYGGFAQAAKQLHRSQSAVSYSIAKLQQQLGIRLLQIDGRKARLTEAGTTLLRQSRQLVQQAVELEQLADNLEQGWEPEIQLVVDAAFPTPVLMKALRLFEPRCPNTRVQLNEVVLSGAEDALTDGSADLAITGQVPANFLADSLMEIEFIAVACAQHPLHQLNRELTTRDLEHETQIVIRDSGIRNKRDAGWLGAEHRWSVSSIETATTAVHEGLGFAWLPKHRVKKLLDRGELLPLPLREGGVYHAMIYLIFGQAREPGPGTRQLAEILHKVAKEES